VKEFSLTRELPGPAATEALGAELALVARAGTAILLQGELGSGKSTLARAFIRALAPPDQTFDIPSPTFTLVQTYDQTRVSVMHADLYRIRSEAEIDELGLDEGLRAGLVMVEWPEKLERALCHDQLRISLSGGGGSRTAFLVGTGSCAQALSRLTAIGAFLSATGWSGASRSFLEGDASFRRYERLSRQGGTYVLMDMPRRSDGPPVKDGKPYSQIAHLAEDIRAVIAVNDELRRRGLSAPKTFACDLDAGLAVIEDLGNRVYGRMLEAGDDMKEPMNEAVRLLARMAQEEWPQSAPLPGVGRHHVPPYDRQALEIEVGLLTEWCWPFLRSEPIGDDRRGSFTAAWSPLFDAVEVPRPVWTLRDYHSPNLMWLPDREGLARVGLIDTQDCVLGHPAYDLASLLQDARVDIPFGTADELFDRYCGYRGVFDRPEFARAYAILGAQRATKILGIFARLSKRDGKHGYLRHIPRVSRYLERNLQHPVLKDLKDWFAQHLPAELRESKSS
jgi:hypothetical protein